MCLKLYKSDEQSKFLFQVAIGVSSSPSPLNTDFVLFFARLTALYKKRNGYTIASVRNFTKSTITNFAKRGGARRRAVQNPLGCFLLLPFSSTLEEDSPSLFSPSSLSSAMKRALIFTVDFTVGTPKFRELLLGALLNKGETAA
mmetsp:Transcript_6117/g.7996  ORF Transcript_6117/g.7996 Transcript_6117/m.7996 type:complete len:144 (-) Transcript_6117:125-556(-)